LPLQRAQKLSTFPLTSDEDQNLLSFLVEVIIRPLSFPWLERIHEACGFFIQSTLLPNRRLPFFFLPLARPDKILFWFFAVKHAPLLLFFFSLLERTLVPL